MNEVKTESDNESPLRAVEEKRRDDPLADAHPFVGFPSCHAQLAMFS